MNIISKKARLPYEVIKGTVQQRDRASINMSKQIISELQQSLCHNDMSPASFRKAIQKASPKNLFLMVERNNDTSCIAGIDSIFTKDKNICGYSLQINPEENQRFCLCSLPNIAHEVRHLTDMLYHPKVLARERKLHARNINIPKYDKFYINELYVCEEITGTRGKKRILKNIKKNVNKFISKFPAEDKINLLQDMRYGLILEDNAFRAQYKIAKQLYNKRYTVYEDDILKQNKDYMFEEKIELLKNMTADLIKKERFKHRIKTNIKNFFEIK